MERLEHGGIPVFWERGNGDAMAALVFRAGVADELPRRRGETHLVEHLTLFPLGRRPYDYNGFVDSLYTVFHARGTQDEVTSFLSEVSRSLADLPLDRFDTEVEVLRTEAGRDAGDFLSRMLSLRFGLTGFGVTNVRELGLGVLTPADIEQRRDQAFTAGNAAVWMYSPEPPRLDFELPDGPRRPPPPAEPLSGVEFPAWVPPARAASPSRCSAAGQSRPHSRSVRSPSACTSGYARSKAWPTQSMAGAFRSGPTSRTWW